MKQDTIESYLEAKYTGGGPGGDRFAPVDMEVHSSQLSDCQRKRKWKHDRTSTSEASPYFELGRVFEILYGSALAFAEDPEVDADFLKTHPPWEVVDKSTYVVQDVNIRIEVGGDATIVGECDWTVFTDRCPGVHSYSEYGSVSEIHVSEDGDRTAIMDSGDELEYDSSWTDRVVETKTKKDVSWVKRKGPDKSHIYQVYPYMHALNVNGQIAYMERNDWTEYVEGVGLDDVMWLDCVSRARQHVQNQSAPEDMVPPATPCDDSECHWCPHKDECIEHGGSKYT